MTVGIYVNGVIFILPPKNADETSKKLTTGGPSYSDINIFK